MTARKLDKKEWRPVEVALEGLDHMVHKPRVIYVDTGAGGLMSVEIIDAEGAKQLVKLRDPLMLPDLRR